MLLRRLTFLAAFGAPLAFAPVAGAGTYDVYSCWAGSDTFRNPAANGSAWAKRSDPGERFSAFDQCGASDNGFGVISVSGYQAPNGAFGELSFTAPAGTRIERVRFWRTAWSYGSGSGGESQRNYLYTLADGAVTGRGDIFDGSSDVPPGMAGSEDVAYHGLIPANVLDYDVSSSTPASVTYRVGCGFAAGCPTGDSRTNFAAGVKIYGAITTLRDSSDPEESVAPTGLLAAGTHRGVEPVRVSAAGDNSGIKRLAVYADEATSPVGVVDFERNRDKCAWWQAVPCQNVTDVDVQVDTRRVSDGTHRFVVRAYDAAENVRAFVSEPVTVKNGTDAKPDSFGTPVPARGPVNGTPASDRAILTATFARNHRAALRLAFRRRAVVAGRLVDEAGAPIAGAQVGVAARSVAGGGPDAPVGTATTGPDGRFRTPLGARGPSRVLVISYFSHVGDDAPTATRELRLSVAAGVRLAPHPRHVHNGQAVTFAGSLLGRPLPATGKLIEMQVKIGHRWHTFATTRARGRRGRFRYRYRFMRTYERVTYRFRALARADGAYPWATGASRTVSVRVN